MTKPKLKKILIYSVLAVAVIGTGTYIFLIQREKAQFNQAEEEIDALYAQITDKVGKPDQEKKVKVCRYAGGYLTKGPLSCSIARYWLYENKDANQSNTITEEAKSLSGDNPLQQHGNKSVNKFVEYDKTFKTNSQQLSQDYSDIGNLNCYILYSYPEIEPYSYDFATRQDISSLQMSITCSGKAMAEHYPVTF